MWIGNTPQGELAAQEFKKMAYRTAENWQKTGVHECWNFEQKYLFALEDLLKLNYENRDFSGSLDRQILGSAYAMVDWKEVAKNILSE
jgi:hypothetical protein